MTVLREAIGVRRLDEQTAIWVPDVDVLLIVPRDDSGLAAAVVRAVIGTTT